MTTGAIASCVWGIPDIRLFSSLVLRGVQRQADPSRLVCWSLMGRRTRACERRFVRTFCSFSVFVIVRLP